MNKIHRITIGLLAAATGLNITVHCMFHAVKAETEEAKRYAEIIERLDDVQFRLSGCCTCACLKYLKRGSE